MVTPARLIKPSMTESVCEKESLHLYAKLFSPKRNATNKARQALIKSDKSP